MKYVFGPVPSRRLGRSLGIDPIPLKTCNYQCIYCQLGKTTNFTNVRKNYISKVELYREIEQAIKLYESSIDYITLVGSGEPTLYKDLKELILKIKRCSNKPICVITNGALLYNDEVKDALYHTDVVLPSLDAGDIKLFKKINRPHRSLKFDDILQGFIDFKKKYTGKFWIEIMLMKDINDSEEKLLSIKKLVDMIQPDRIDINVPIRPPTEKWVQVPNKSVIEKVEHIFKDFRNLNILEEGLFHLYSTNFENELLNIIQRHPMRQEQIIETFSSDKFGEKNILRKISELESQHKIEKTLYNAHIYWKRYTK